MQGWTRVAVALGALAGAASCAGNRMDLNGYTDAPPVMRRAGLLELRWHRRLADHFDIDYRPVYRGGPAYDRATDRAYVGSLDGGFYAVRGRDGAEIWRFATLGRVDSTPAIDRDMVFFGGQDGALYALDAETGRMRWRVPTSAEIVHAPVVLGEGVYSINGNDVLLAVARSTGHALWRYRRNAAGGISLSGHAGVSTNGSRLFAGFSDGTVACLDPTDGSVVWEIDTSIDIENIEARNEAHDPIDVDTTPLVLNDTVYVASFTAGVYALDITSGNRRWRVDNVLQVSGLASDGRYLYASSAVSGLVKIDPFDGSVLWARDLGSHAIQEAVRVGRGLMAVPLADRGLWLVRTSDGEPVDGILPGYGFGAPPAIAGDRLIAASNGGELYSLRLVGRR